MREEMKQNTGTDTAQLPDELFIEQATRRVKLGLIVGEVIRQNDIKQDAAKIDEKLETLAATYEEPQALIEYYRGNAQAMQTIEAAVMEDMIVEWVLNQAEITEENKTFDEIMNPAPAEA
jgi:trigger factor